MRTAAKKPARHPAAPPEPQVKAVLHREFWAFLWRHYHRLDKFTLPDTDREPLAQVMHAVGQRSHLEGDIEVWGPAHGFTVLTQWICREMCACAPSMTKRVWATCGMHLTPQIAAQDNGRGFSREQC